MESNNINNRIDWIDTAKGIGLLLVIFGHLHTPYFCTWIYTFHMPLFFLLSGVVFSGNKYSFKSFLLKRIKSLVIPYFVLGLVILLFYIVLNATLSPDIGPYGTNMQMIKGLLIQKHFWTIWFLACLFVVEIMYFLINRLFGNNLVIETIVSVALCVIGLVSYRFGCQGLPWNIDIAIVAQFFFHVGYTLKRKLVFDKILQLKARPYLLCMSFSLFVNVLSGIVCIKLSGSSLDMSVGLYGNEFLTMISALTGSLFIIMLSNKLKRDFLIYLGKNTMIIFSWHSRIIIVLCGYIYSYIGVLQGNGIFERYAYSAVTFIIILAVLIPINEVIKKSKFHAIFGV